MTSSADTIRLALIGAGPWGRNYIKTLAGLPGVALIRVASRNPETARLVPRDCSIHAQWEEVATATDIDGVIIATPPPLHYRMARAAIEGGNPALVEKPLTLDPGEARALGTLAAGRKALVMVGHTYLYHPAFEALEAALPTLGPLRGIEAEAGRWGPFRSETPVLWDWGAHDVAMCCDLLAARPTAVQATVLESRQVAEGLGEVIRLTLTFPGDIRATLVFGNLFELRKRTFQVRGERGALLFDDLAQDKLVRKAADRPDARGEAIATDTELPLTRLLRRFVAAIRNGDKDRRTLELGIGVVEVLDRCQRSLAAA